jgi:polyhydroxybutyrate depolymerase
MKIALSIGEVERRYLLHVPSLISGPMPAVLMLHGAGGSAAWARDETRWNETAERHGFAVAYPDGLAVDPSRSSGFLDNPQVWNAGAGPGLIVNHGPDDVGFLAAVIDDLPRHAPTDSRRVFVTGFSNGAAMTFRFASERPELVAAIAPVAGYCPEVKPLSRPVPTLFIVGNADPLVPIHGGEVLSPWSGQWEYRPPLTEALARWAVASGADEQPLRSEFEDRIRRDDYSVDFRVVTIAELGHHWPGGRGRLLRRLAGQPSNRFNANEVIWNFFRSRM